MQGQLMTINQIRNYVDKFVGKKVILTVNHSRNKRSVNRGVVTETYAKHFIVKIDKAAAAKNECFLYADILTKTIELRLQDEKVKVS